MQNQRTCMGCNEKKDKKELIRIVRNKDGEVFVDMNEKLQGRGAYCCKNIKCLEKLEKTKRLDKKLECKVNGEIYEKIRGVIIGK